MNGGREEQLSKEARREERDLAKRMRAAGVRPAKSILAGRGTESERGSAESPAAAAILHAISHPDREADTVAALPAVGDPSTSALRSGGAWEEEAHGVVSRASVDAHIENAVKPAARVAFGFSMKKK